MEQPNLIGVGLYPISEAARIIGVKPLTLRRWVTEYTYMSHGTEYQHEPVLHRSLAEHKGVLTFLELVELLFVKQFREAGLSMKFIRLAASVAACKYNTPYPFALGKFDTDGTAIFETLRSQANGDFTVEDIVRGQYAFESMVRPFFKKLEYNGDLAEAARFWPLDRKGRVVLDPEREFGAPIDAETGVPTRALYDAVRAGSGQDYEAVAKWFEVPVAAVAAAVRYEQQLAAA